jgi:hypothetical protein
MPKKPETTGEELFRVNPRADGNEPPSAVLNFNFAKLRPLKYHSRNDLLQTKGR